MNTNGMLKLREDTAHISKLDKIVREPPKKETYGYQPPWLKFENGKMVEVTIEEVEASAAVKIKEQLETIEEEPKRFQWLRRLIQIFRELCTIDYEAERE